MAVACGVVGVAVEFSDIKETVLSVQEGNAHGVFVRAGGEKPQSVYRGAVFGGVYFAAGIGKHAAAVGYVDIISVEGNSADMAGEGAPSASQRERRLVWLPVFSFTMLKREALPPLR